MSVPRRSSSLHCKNKTKYEYPVDNLRSTLLMSGSQINRPLTGKQTKDLEYYFPSPLSRRTSLSSNLIHELQKNTRYRQQKAKLEDRKSKSVEFLEIASRGRTSDKHKSVSASNANKRKSTSLSDFKKVFGNMENIFKSKIIDSNLKSPGQIYVAGLSSNSPRSKRTSRKFNLNTRSVWYDNNEENQNPTAYNLRKAASLDSILVDKPTRIKITKDMISAPIYIRKIIGEWSDMKTIDSFSILEEKESSNSTSNYCESRDSDSVYSSSSETDNEKVVNDTPSPVDENINFRPKDNNLFFKNRRKNILFLTDKLNTDLVNIKEHFEDNVIEIEEEIDSNKIELKTENSGELAINISEENLDIEEEQLPNFSKFEIIVNNKKIIQSFSSITDVRSSNIKRDFMIGNGTYSPENFIVKHTFFDKNVNKETHSINYQKNKDSGSSNLFKMKGLSKSSDVLSSFRDGEEVLRTLQSNKDEPLSRGVGPFPKTDDHLFSEGVQLRTHRTDGKRQSQTVGCDPRPLFRNQDFDVKGCVKINLTVDNKIVKLSKNDCIRYTNHSIIRNDELLKCGVILRTIKLINKKEVELKDINNHSYILIFDSSKDAKLFTESDKVSTYTDSEKSTITKTLLRLLGKRSSREVLEKKGIYQNEPIFGNTLRNIYGTKNGVPTFILKTMELIERPDNITSLGLYRTSGNLATIQKIRLEVDKGNLDILDNYSKDPDVLTGSLKLFFRELKEPLLSCKTCDNLLGFTKNDMNYCKKDRDNIRTILTHIPEANSETLLALIKHLIKVVEYKDQNKMDTYNLAVCWGPTIIFATDNANTKDLVTQSAEATKLFDALINFYINNPEELELRKKKQDMLDSNRNMIHRQDSKDSIQSSDSGHSSKNKSSSNLSLDAIDEVLKKSVELIEGHLNYEGLYRKNGSPEKVAKILKKMLKRKLVDMEKYKSDVYDLTDALKKYLKEGCDSLVTKETVEHVNKICDNTQWLEHNARQRVITVVTDVPKKDTLIFIIRHLIKLIKHEASHNVSKAEIILIWSRVLNDHMRIIESEEKMNNFLKILLDVFDESKCDISTVPKGMSNGLLNDLKNLQKEKDRVSKYDNIPDETEFISKEATILEEKTEDIEHTKL